MTKCRKAPTDRRQRKRRGMGRKKNVANERLTAFFGFQMDLTLILRQQQILYGKL